MDTNRYSVPFTLIGRAVEVLRTAGRLVVFHRGTVVAEHPELSGKYQVRILPEHGPGAIARTARRARSAPRDSSPESAPFAEVEVRDLTLYDRLTSGSEGDSDGRRSFTAGDRSSFKRTPDRRPSGALASVGRHKTLPATGQ